MIISLGKWYIGRSRQLIKIFFFAVVQVIYFVVIFQVLLSLRSISKMCGGDGEGREEKFHMWHFEKKYGMIVTYWPSTEPSIEKEVHPVEDITLTYGQVEFGVDATPTRSRWM